MKTIIIPIDEAAKDLESFIRRLRESANPAILMGPNGALAHITPVLKAGIRPDLGEVAGAIAPKASESSETRYVRCPITGYSVVAARPGQRLVSSEEIYEELRGSFP